MNFDIYDKILLPGGTLQSYTTRFKYGKACHDLSIRYITKLRYNIK